MVPAIEKICYRHIQLGRSRLNNKDIFMLVQSGENDERKRERNSFHIHFVHIFQEIERLAIQFSS